MICNWTPAAATEYSSHAITYPLTNIIIAIARADAVSARDPKE